MTLRLSPKQKAGLAVALALLLWAPSGVSEENFPVVTGHSVFYNGDTFDKCLASIAGIMRSRVMWFNDMVLTERYAGRGTFIYVTEAGGVDPRDGYILYSEGVFYDFVDPNGAHWHVEELYIDFGTDVYVHGPSTSKPGEGDVGAGLHETKQYVWVVELSERPIHDEFAGDPTGPYYHDLYNFLLIVDTCKMNRDNSQPGYRDNSTQWNLTHKDEDLSTERGHPAGTKAHQHEIHDVYLYVGTRPIVAVGGVDNKNPTWAADWATSDGAKQNAANAPGQAANQTGAG